MRLDRRAVLAGLAGTAAAGGAGVARSAPSEAGDAAAMRRAAGDFLAAMGDAVAAARFAFDDPLRRDWHWFPQRFYRRREGVTLASMSSDARDAAMALLAASTTPNGFAKAAGVMRLQEKLGRDPGDFHVSVYGDPADRLGAWGWSLEGHHLSLNYTVVADRISAGPLFLGARPTVVPEWSGVDRAPMRIEEEAARALLLSLDAEKKAMALYDDATPGDTITRSRSEVAALPPEGLPMSDMAAAQRDRALEVVREYVSAMPPSLAARTFENVAATSDDALWFGWSGAAENGLYYYRLSGPGWFIEHDNSRNQATHIHSVWRDIEGDFGRALLRG